MSGKMFAGAILVATLGGCAATDTRKSLENVAKQWCETIRASQIVCTYPMTEDLVPGDVFLVQTTIQDQSALYRERGFLSLDDRQIRLNPDYKADYFDGYWKDTYGDTPHVKPSLSSTPPGAVEAPRAAFPSYTFDVSNSSGATLALPINGIPIGLGYLHAEKATGTVLLSNAYTYAADTGNLYGKLKTWASENQEKLNMTLRQSGMDSMLLRVVSRVYLVGGVNVTLTNSANTGAQASLNGGNAPELAASGVDAASTLTAQTNQIKTLLPGSGGIKFLSATASSVSLVETFDRPLVVGYLGFDVPVFSGGVLGAPIPVFEHLEGRKLGMEYPLTSIPPDMSAYQFQILAFKGLAAKNPAQALAIAKNVSAKLDSSEFENTLLRIARVESNQDPKQRDALTQNALDEFVRASNRYVTAGGKTGPRYGTYADSFSAAFNNER